MNAIRNVRRSQWSRGLRRRSAAARLLKLWVRIPPGSWMSVCCECRVSSDRGLCDDLITRPEESYRLWCVVVYNLETSWMRRPWPMGKKKKKHPVGIHCVGWPVRYSNWCLLCQNLTVRKEHFKKCHTGFRNGTFAFGRPRRLKITSWIRLFLGKLRVPNFASKLLIWYGTRNIITMFTYMYPELVLILSKIFIVVVAPLDFFKVPVSLLRNYA